VTELGSTGGGKLVVDGQFDVELSVLRDTWTRTRPDALG
jgi:hypothetical protein